MKRLTKRIAFFFILFYFWGGWGLHYHHRRSMSKTKRKKYSQYSSAVTINETHPCMHDPKGVTAAIGIVISWWL